jgi:hypothetical protein
MGWLARTLQWRPRVVVPAPPPPENESVVFPSPGMAYTLARLCPDGSGRVLDLGPAVAANVATLSGRARGLYIADLAGERAALGGNESHAAFLDRHLPDSSGDFDVVLAWDCLNYFEPELARMCVARLMRLCKPEGCVFAMVFAGDSMPALPSNYAIVDDEHLEYRRIRELRPSSGLRPQTVERLFAGFSIEHSFVLQNGVQEFVALRE